MFAALRGLGPGCDAEFGGLLIFALCFFFFFFFNVTHSVTAEADALKLMFPDGTGPEMVPNTPWRCDPCAPSPVRHGFTAGRLLPASPCQRLPECFVFVFDSFRTLSEGVKLNGWSSIRRGLLPEVK